MAADQPTLFDLSPPTSRYHSLTPEQKRRQVQRTKAWREQNREKAREDARRRYHATKTQITPEQKARKAEYFKAYTAANRERINALHRESDKKRYAADPGKYRKIGVEKQRKRYSDPAKRAALLARYKLRYATEPEFQAQTKDRVHRRRLKVSGSGKVSAAEWRAVLSYFGHRCAYCRRSDRPLTQDHIEPLDRGGLHTASNLAPACGPCNSSKRNATLIEFLILRDLISSRRPCP